MSAKKDRLILVANDDGIFSKGIRALVEVAERFGRVIVVAPDRQQSAVGHSITISEPLRTQKFEMKEGVTAISVNGTPADCVKLATDQLLKEKPDLVLSGINHGSNAGINIIYSGTVSAATEGTILGFPSIAVSCMDFAEDADLSGAQEAAVRAVQFVFDNGLPRGITLNVNAPAGPFKGMRWARQGDSRYTDEYVARVDPVNRPYYWMFGRLEVLDEAEDVDINVLKSGYASITPIQYDLTAYKVFEAMSGMDL